MLSQRVKFSSFLWPSSISLCKCTIAVVPTHLLMDTWQGCGEIATLVDCRWECEMVQSFQETIWQFLNKLKIELPHDPAIPLLSIYPKELKVSKRYFYNHVHRNIIAKTWKHFMFINGWMAKRKYIRTMEYYWALKKERHSAIYHNINERWGHYAKWSKLVTKRKYCMIPLIWGREAQSIKTKYSGGCPGLGEGRMKSHCFKDVEFFWGVMKEF